MKRNASTLMCIVWSSIVFDLNVHLSMQIYHDPNLASKQFNLCLSCIFLSHSPFLFFVCFIFHSIVVKFLREVTPYFRKASIISEVGWELQRQFLCPLSSAPTMINPNGSNMLSTSSKSPPGSAPKSPPRADTRYIPLQLTHLARNLKYHDPGTLNGFRFAGPTNKKKQEIRRVTANSE